MAGTCITYRGKNNIGITEFVCDTVEEINQLPTMTKGGTGVFEAYSHPVPMGSTCIVGNEGGTELIYMLFSFGWKKLGGE